MVAPEPQEFARAIHCILQHPEDRRRRVRAAIETAQRLDWPAVSGNFHSLYRDLYARTAGEEVKAGLEPAFWSRQNNSFNAN